MTFRRIQLNSLDGPPTLRTKVKAMLRSLEEERVRILEQIERESQHQQSRMNAIGQQALRAIENGDRLLWGNFGLQLKGNHKMDVHSAQVHVIDECIRMMKEVLEK